MPADTKVTDTILTGILYSIITPMTPIHNTQQLALRTAAPTEITIQSRKFSFVGVIIFLNLTADRCRVAKKNDMMPFAIMAIIIIVSFSMFFFLLVMCCLQKSSLTLTFYYKKASQKIVKQITNIFNVFLKDWFTNHYSSPRKTLSIRF